LKNGRYHFEIEDPDDKSDSLKLEFINSEFMTFDNNLKMLKKNMILVFSLVRNLTCTLSQVNMIL